MEGQNSFASNFLFLWLVRQNRILTRDNLLKKGLIGIHTVFCDGLETVDHLFVQCSVASSIWQWIALHNGFDFEMTSIQELWDIGNCIPLKDANLVELARGAVIWNIWLERNRIIFQDGQVKNI